MRKESPDTGKRWIAFFPDHFLSEVTVLGAVLLVLLLGVQFMPYALEEMADPNNTPMGAKPPWYFYFLYQLLKYFPPLLAAVFIPAAGVLLLFALPFLDKNPAMRPAARKVAMAVGVLGVVALVGLTYLGSLHYDFE